MTSHPLYSWHLTQSICHHLLYTCNIKDTVSITRHLIIIMTSYSVYMTSHMVYEWQYNHDIWHHIHSIRAVTRTWLMISHPMYVWNHSPCMYDTISTIYDLTTSLDDIIPLFVCLDTHYVYDIISTLYDVKHNVCMTRQVLYLTWNTFYLASHLLYMS